MLLALLDAAGAKQAALAGHSMGSLIALEATARAPQRVSRLVLMGTAYPMQVSAAREKLPVFEMARNSLRSNRFMTQLGQSFWEYLNCRWHLFPMAVSD